MTYKSAIESIPGKDALVEHNPSLSYPAKSYIEKNGLIYKSLAVTTTGFTSSQWELVADLREIRVRNILDRNALTGSTPTSGTTGIRIPILDNTNVLVLNAINNNFARYNYNKGNNSWLLLQVGTGSTSASTTVYYQNILNKPSIISGVTVTAGNGLSGGGSIYGINTIPYANGGNINISHADTSTIGNINNSGYAYVQKLNFDTYGHVTGSTSSTWVHPSGLTQNIVNTNKTYIQSISVSNGHITSISSSSWVHPDTSSQASSTNSGNVFIQSINLDGDGHVTGINTGTVSSGSGYSFKLNGNTGGAITVASGGTVTISGGTNISTVRGGDSNNPWLRINFTPAGSNTQVQLNSGGFLGASANFTYNTSTNTLTSPKIVLSTAPSVGTLNDNILIRNTTSGLIEKIATTSIVNASNGLNKNGAYIRLGGSLTGNTTISGSSFGMNFSNKYVATVSGNSTNPSHTFIGNLTTGLFVPSSNELGVTANGLWRMHYYNNEVRIGNDLTSKNLSNESKFIIEGARNTPSAGLYVGSLCFSNDADNATQTSAEIAKVVCTLQDATANHGALEFQTKDGASLATRLKIDKSGVLSISATPATDNTNDLLVWNSTTGAIGKTSRTGLGGSGTPAGANTQIQFNNNGSFGAVSNLTFNTGSSTFNTTNISLSGIQIFSIAPSVGTLNDNILIRDSGTGVIQRISTASIGTANNGITKIGNNYVLGGTLTGNTTISGSFGLNFLNNYVTIGSRSGSTGMNSLTSGINNLASSTYSQAFGQQVKSSGVASMAQGYLTLASGNYSHAEGQQTSATGTSSHVEGYFSKAWGLSSHAEGGVTKSLGMYSHSEGYYTVAYGNYSHAEGSSTTTNGNFSHAEGGDTIAFNDGCHSQGQTTKAYGVGSHSGGFGDSTKYVIASGTSSFNHSRVTGFGIIGAVANYSAILGGLNNNIQVGNIGASIIGGNSVTLTGSSYVYTTAVSNLAIMSTPSSGLISDDVLVRRASTGKIMSVTQASISDERLKKNFIPLTNVLSNIDTLSTVEFQYNEKNQPEIVNTSDYGLLAQEIEKIYPYVVKNNLKIEGDDEIYKTVEYRKLVPVLFAAIKELNNKIKELENKIK